MFKKILIANRGEIACRVIKTARRMGIATVAVYSDADAEALHVRLADEAVHIGAAPAAESYLIIDKIVEACRQTGAEAVHPGYGFLSERAAFPEALAAVGIAFIGPPPGAIEAMGDKITSKKLAAEAGVSTVPGYMGLIEDADEAVKIAGEIGYPVMIKASAGGGGKGMRIAWDDADAREGLQASKNEAKASFGDDRIFIEKFVTSPRHIEIQVLADSHGNTIYLGERECSIQRRNQKVIEEAPSPFLDAATRKAMGEQSCALAAAVGYTSAGTVEFIVDGERNFYFLEMNTRLQVEHPVTELITGVDLVEQMIRVAHGEQLAITQDDITLNGWAMESRLYAEDPYRGFLPSIGRLTRYRPPEETEAETADGILTHATPGIDPDEGIVRNDTGVYEGGEISKFYDPMIAKLCTWGRDRSHAIQVMRSALDAFEVEGIGHNLPFVAAVMEHSRFVKGEITTGFIAEEFPDGFHGVDPDEDVMEKLVRAAVAMHAIHATRDALITGQLRDDGRLPSPWVNVKIGASSWLARMQDHVDGPDGDIEAPGLMAVHLEDEDAFTHVLTTYVPGDTLAAFAFETETVPGFDEGADLVLKVDRRTEGFRIRYRGADLDVKLRTPRAAELAALMPVKEAADTSKMLLCPMPGTVVSIAVAEGDAVQEGQALCTVEAMKMENVLRAEKSATVAKINVAAGAGLQVDDVIMEFE
ncbi:MAG: acetyl/propionyl/methylcrotonyl-CoA carboxylase subunit alpha [Pseudomonadota bacterium]